MRKEYDFSKGIRGKYSKKYKAGMNIVLLDLRVNMDSYLFSISGLLI
jgi:hypothetical protein